LEELSGSVTRGPGLSFFDAGEPLLASVGPKLVDFSLFRSMANSICFDAISFMLGAFFSKKKAMLFSTSLASSLLSNFLTFTLWRKVNPGLLVGRLRVKSAV